MLLLWATRTVSATCGSVMGTRTERGLGLFPAFRDVPAITILELHGSSGRNDLLPLLAQAVDPERDVIADIEELRRLHASAYAGRRARCDDVAGQERQELRDIGYALRHREDHGRRVSGLPSLSVDVEPQSKFLHVRDLVLG